MTTIIATIKPHHLTNIRKYGKLIELRKRCPKSTPFKVLCCESGSGGRIIAEFEVHTLLHFWPAQNPVLIYHACVSMADALKYADGKPLWGWQIDNMIDYCSTDGYRVRNISEFGLKRPPQSWQYVKEGGSDE